MYQRILSLAIALVLLTFSAYADKLDDVIKKHADTQGYNNFKTVTSMKSSVTMKQMGMEIPMMNYMKKPNKFRSEQEFMGQKMIMTFNGTEGWMMMQGNVNPMPEQQVEQFKDNMMLENQNPLIDWKDKGSQVKLLGKEKTDDIECYKIEVVDKKGDKSNVFISASEYFLHKIVTTTPQGEVEITFKNRKKVNGIMIPFEISMKLAQGTGSIVFNSIDFNVDLNDSLFEKPSLDK